MQFSETLMELRKSRGLSQEELGFRLNVTRQTISQWETGQTTPEMDQLMAMAKLFEISIDALTGNAYAPRIQGYQPVYPQAFHYEYESKRKLFGLPLVHINIGIGLRKARGIIAVGTIARGVVAIGALSCGVIAIGALTMGVAAFGAVALGLFALGGFSVGAVALGGISAGLLSIGAFAFGKYALGAFAIATDIAMGGTAYGHIAVGDTAKGAFAWENLAQLTPADFAEIRQRILQEFPRIWHVILDLFT